MIIQVVMVGIIIAFPQMVMHYKGPAVDPTNVQITLPQMPTLQQPARAPAARRALGAPQLGAPQLGRAATGRRRCVDTPPAAGN